VIPRLCYPGAALPKWRTTKARGSEEKQEAEDRYAGNEHPTTFDTIRESIEQLHRRYKDEHITECAP